MCTAAELRLHADDQIKEFFSLNHLRDGLSTYGGGDHGFHVGYIDAVASDFVTIDVDQQAWLPQFADDGEIGETSNMGERVLDLDRFVLQDVQIVAVDFDGERTLQAGERFVYGVFGGLSVVENNSRESSELLIYGFDELLFLAYVTSP